MRILFESQVSSGKVFINPDEPGVLCLLIRVEQISRGGPVEQVTLAINAGEATQIVFSV